MRTRAVARALGDLRPLLGGRFRRRVQRQLRHVAYFASPGHPRGRALRGWPRPGRGTGPARGPQRGVVRGHLPPQGRRDVLRPPWTRRCSRRLSTASPIPAGPPSRPRSRRPTRAYPPWPASRRSPRTRTNLIRRPRRDVPGHADPHQGLVEPRSDRACNAPAAAGEGSLHTALSDLLGRFQDLYNDGTIPQSTESMARVVNAFKAATDAQTAWGRFDARAGVPAPSPHRPRGRAADHRVPRAARLLQRDPRPALGRLAALPAEPAARRQRQPHPGPRPGVPAAHAADERRPRRAPQRDRRHARPQPHADRRRDDGRHGAEPPAHRPRVPPVHLLRAGIRPSAGARRGDIVASATPRGYAMVLLAGGKLPSLFVDADGDGLPDVEASGSS